MTAKVLMGVISGGVSAHGRVGGVSPLVEIPTCSRCSYRMTFFMTLRVEELIVYIYVCTSSVGKAVELRKCCWNYSSGWAALVADDEKEMAATGVCENRAPDEMRTPAAELKREPNDWSKASKQKNGNETIIPENGFGIELIIDEADNESESSDDDDNDRHGNAASTARGVVVSADHTSVNDDDEEWAGEEYEEDADKVFLQFKRVIGRCPNQVLRILGSDDAKAVLPTSDLSAEADSLRECGSCGSKRTFRIQILSTCLSELQTRLGAIMRDLKKSFERFGKLLLESRRTQTITDLSKIASIEGWVSVIFGICSECRNGRARVLVIVDN